MKNPFPIYFWMLGCDVREGDLLRRGFTQHRHPLGEGSKIYRMGPWALHNSGMWRMDKGVSYDRERGLFFFSAHTPVASSAERLRFAEGWECFLPFIESHEAWIAHWRGPAYRSRLLKIVPPGLRPLRRALRSAVSA